MSEENDRKRERMRAHTLADHRYGMDADHVHDHESDHDHDHDHDHEHVQDGVDAEALRGEYEVPLTSVGIDIGSSGTQVVFSRLKLERRAHDPGGRFSAVERTVLFQSPIEFTPYADGDRIDRRALGDIVERAYAAAGLHPDAVDAGAVILTGTALQRENAQAIASELAEIGGEFVCSAAGHHMEAMLAAYGSGSALASHERNMRVLNIDIGGGTTKLALIDDGRVSATGAIAIGGRLLVVDADYRITRLDAAARRLAEQAGFRWSCGDVVTAQALDELCEWMADRVVEVIVAESQTAVSDALYLTEPLGPLGDVDAVRFSGGVAEYVYARERRDFGDLGRRLGLALRQRIDAGRLPWPLMPPGECIRATALGASSYGVQLSGRTIYVSDPGSLLPRMNLQVLQPEFSLAVEQVDSVRLAAAIRRHFTAFDVVEGDSDVALVFRWQGDPCYGRLSAFARGILVALPRTIAQSRPLYIILDGDVAQTLGALLKEELGLASAVLVIDGVTLWDFDYVDLGRIRMPSYTVPVTIKSLVFKDDPRLPHSHAHRHHWLDIGARR